MVARVLEGVIDPVAHLVPDDAADANPAGIGQGFQPRRDVDAVAEDVLALRNYIAEVDAHSELDPLLDWSSRIALDHPALHLDPAAHSIDDARELGQKAVAGVLHDPAAVFGDLRIHQLF